MTGSDQIPSLYHHSARIPWASWLSLRVRRQIFDAFLVVMRPTPASRVLDVGVTSDRRYAESNFFERLYPYKERLVCVGTEDGAHLELDYPGVRFVRVRAGFPLPFDAQAFDIVFSSAVVEHVGSSVRQRAFIAELCRVGRAVFITTPNRWFPVEHHTGLPLLHWLPRRIFRSLIRHTGFSHWSNEEHLHALGRRDLAALFPPSVRIGVRRVGPGLGVFRSNLIAHTVPRTAEAP